MHTKALTVICDWNDLIKTQASKGALNEESELRGFETRVVNFISLEINMVYLRPFCDVFICDCNSSMGIEIVAVFRQRFVR